MNKIFFLGILILGVLVISCEKEPLTVGDAIDLGELEGTNYAQLNEDVKLLEDSEMHLSLDSTGLLLKGPMTQYDSLDKGDIICKLTLENEDDFTYYREIVSITEVGGNTYLETEPVGFPDVFKRIRYDSRNSEGNSILFRNDFFSYGFAYKPASPVLLQEIKGFVDPDLSLGIEYDTSQSYLSIEYDNILGITPQIEFNLKDLIYTGSFKICLGGQASLGYKNDKIIIEPIKIGPPAYGLQFYFLPKVEALLKLKGEACSNTITFETNPNTYSAVLNLNSPEINYTSNELDPEFQIEPWVLAGQGTLEGLAGGDFYLSNIGTRATQLLKAGLTGGFYARGTIKAKGALESFTPSFKLTADAGIKAKAFLSAEMFGGTGTTIVGNAIKGKAFWETSDFRLPIFQWDYEINGPCSRDYTNSLFNEDASNLTFRLDCTNCGSAKYYISFNDSTVTDGNGSFREFEYNQEHTITPPTFYYVNNEVTFQDTEEKGCFLIKEFTDPSFGHDNCTTFTDPRDGDIYCVTTIGDQTWLRENLRYDAAGGRWYNDEESLFNVFCGRLYTYEEVQAAEANGGICPPGFRLPTSEDFETLVANSGGNVNAGRALKYPSPSFWSNSDLPSIGTFNAVAAGVYYPWLDFPLSFNNSFGQQLEFAYFWTSTTETLSNGKVYPKALVISQNNGITAGGLSITSAPGVFGVIENLGISCRCIQE